jgi:hypothetical protein
MVTIYQVIDHDGECLAVYLDQSTAERHREACEERFPSDVNIKEIQVNQLPGEYIYVSGKILGYQFKRRGYGGRTFCRKVFDIRQTPKSITGKTIIKGRILTVVFDEKAWLYARRTDSQARWRATELLGWTE